LKYPKPITALDDEMYLKMNDTLYDYIAAPRIKDTLKDSDEAIALLNKLEQSIPNKQIAQAVKKNAKALKTNINNLGLKYGKLLFDNPDDAIKDFGKTIVENGGAYLKQVYSIMKNKAYDFDPEAIKGAEKFFVKNTIPQINKLEPNTIPNFAKANGLNIEEAEKLFAQKTMADIELDKAKLELDKQKATVEVQKDVMLAQTKIKSTESIAGAKIGAEAEMQQKDITTKEVLEGAKLGAQAINKEKDIALRSEESRLRNETIAHTQKLRDRTEIKETKDEDNTN